MDSPDGLLGLAEAAAELGVSSATLRAQVHRGRLRAIKVGRDWLVTSSEVARYRAEVQKSPTAGKQSHRARQVPQAQPDRR